VFTGKSICPSDLFGKQLSLYMSLYIIALTDTSFLCKHH